MKKVLQHDIPRDKVNDCGWNVLYFLERLDRKRAEDGAERNPNGTDLMQLLSNIMASHDRKQFLAAYPFPNENDGTAITSISWENFLNWRTSILSFLRPGNATLFLMGRTNAIGHAVILGREPANGHRLGILDPQQSIIYTDNNEYDPLQNEMFQYFQKGHFSGFTHIFNSVKNTHHIRGDFTDVIPIRKPLRLSPEAKRQRIGRSPSKKVYKTYNQRSRDKNKASRRTRKKNDIIRKNAKIRKLKSSSPISSKNSNSKSSRNSNDSPFSTRLKSFA